MDENIISEIDDNNIDFDKKYIPNKQYPPFGETLDFKKLARHAISLCPTLIINNVNGAVIMKRNTSIEDKEANIKLDGDNNTEEVKPLTLNDKKKTQKDRKKPKRSRIVAEYQASQIPNNKGSIMSIDDLVKFVNGNDKNINANKGPKSLDNKQRKFITNKQHKQSNKVSIHRNVDISRDEILSSAIAELDSPRKDPSLIIPVRYETTLGCDETSSELDSKQLDNEDTDAGAFFQVVRRKSRHKKMNSSLPHCDVNKDEYCPVRFDRVVADKFSFNKGTIIPNDKESLNVFINKLWIEFQSCYEKYIREERNQLHQTTGY